MSILLGRTTLADFVQASSNQRAVTLQTSTALPSLNLINSCNVATLQTNDWVSGAVGSNFMWSNLSTACAVASLGSNYVTFATPTSFQDNVTMASNVAISATLTVASNMSASNIGANNMQVVNRLIASNVGIGVNVPLEALHVAANALIGNTLTASNIYTNAVGQGANNFRFLSDAVHIPNLTVDGSLLVNGSLAFNNNLNLVSVAASSSLAASNITVQRVATSASGVYTYETAAVPLLQADIKVSSTILPVLRLDPQGRLALGSSAAPAHVLHLERTIHNAAVTSGLILARNSGSIGAFSVDSNAHVGIGTAIPFGSLDIHVDAPAASPVIRVQNSVHNLSPYMQFRSNSTVVFDIDGGGVVSIGSNTNSVAPLVPVATDVNVVLKVGGSATVGKTLWLSNVQGWQSGNAIGMSNVRIRDLAQLDSCNVACSNLTATTVTLGSLTGTTATLGGFAVTASNVVSSIDVLAFTGTRMLIAPLDTNLAELQSTPASQGTLKVVAPAGLTLQRAAGFYGASPSIYLKMTGSSVANSANVELEQNTVTGYTGRMTMNNDPLTPSMSLLFQRSSAPTEYKFVKMLLSSNNRTLNFMDGLVTVADLTNSTTALTANVTNAIVNGAVTVGAGSAANLVLTVNGRAAVTGTVTAASFPTTSDLRVKTDLAPITDALGKVAQLTGYTFWRTDLGLRGTGLIAQEVQRVLPEAVTEVVDTRLTLAYGELAGLFVQAIKELTARCEHLEKEVERFSA
jgi:hypothetical protein